MIKESNVKIVGKFELQRLKLAYKIGHKLGKKDKEITKKYLKQPVRTIPSLSDEIAEWIESGKPMLLARLGGTEGNIAGQYCEKALKSRKDYASDTLDWLFTTSGFFADDYEYKTKAVDEYARLTLEGLKECDYLLYDLKKIKDNIKEKEYEMERIKKEQENVLKENNAKVLKIGEYPAQNV